MAKNPLPLANVEKVILLATPDPLPLALTVLAVHARTLPLEIVIFAPSSEADTFDGWGRPLPQGWEHRALALPEFEQRVHLCADPAAQAERIVAAAHGYGSPEGLLGVGVADNEVLSYLENALIRAGLAAYNPAGRKRRGDGFYHLLAALAALAREPSFAAVEALARCPDFLAFLQVRLGRDFSAARWLEGLDELRSRHLPTHLATPRGHQQAREIASVSRGWVRACASSRRSTNCMLPLPEAMNLPPVCPLRLGWIFDARQLDLVRENDARLEDSAAAWMEIVRECAEARARFPGPTTIEWWDLALELFGESLFAGDKPGRCARVAGRARVVVRRCAASGRRRAQRRQRA